MLHRRKRDHPSQFCIRCDQPLEWQGVQHVEVKGEPRTLNIYRCELCDKLSAVPAETSRQPGKRTAKDHPVVNELS